MSKLPRALADALAALADCSDLLDRLITLVFLRQLCDKTMPTIAGHNPRELLDTRFESWRGVIVETEDRAVRIEVLARRLNEILGQGLLSVGWPELEPGAVKRALEGITRWKPQPAGGGDVLGELLQLIRPPGGGRGQQAFYTPYHVCVLMAKLSGVPAPGETVHDPCCGSGRMLLAALEVCREQYGPQATRTVLGSDLDGHAVKVSSLNMVLAGIAPTGAQVLRTEDCAERRRVLNNGSVETFVMPERETRTPRPAGQHNAGRRRKVAVGRNDPCPCGSRVKSKRCCQGSAERAHHRPHTHERGGVFHPGQLSFETTTQGGDGMGSCGGSGTGSRGGANTGSRGGK